MKYNAPAIQQHQAARLLTADFKKTRENILGDGLKLCHRAKAHNSTNPNTAYIAVQQTQSGYKANMKDVAHCGNAHLCSFCSSAKAHHMRLWINQEFLPAVNRQGLFLGLLTLTAHHKRESDWSAYAKNFYLALAAFANAMQRDFKTLGSIGRVRTMECPVGSNGLHLHIHDLFTYKSISDLEALKAITLKKWKAALRKHGLHCSKRGVDIQVHGDFNPHYIAKELAAHDTKDGSKSDLVTLFKLLDKSARGDKQAGADWVRAARAIQGRDRWNVGQLAHKLGIPSPSDWKRPTDVTLNPDTPVLIAYPHAHHMVATSPANERAGLAFILRAARNEVARPGSVLRMVERMCAETMNCEISAIKTKLTTQLAHMLKDAARDSADLAAFAIKKQQLGMRFNVRYTYAAAEYRAKTAAYMYPAPKPVAAPTVHAPAAFVPTIAPKLELDFA